MARSAHARFGYPLRSQAVTAEPQAWAFISDAVGDSMGQGRLVDQVVLVYSLTQRFTVRFKYDTLRCMWGKNAALAHLRYQNHLRDVREVADLGDRAILQTLVLAQQ